MQKLGKQLQQDVHQNKPVETYREIQYVTLIGNAFDLVLGIVKIIARFVSHSQALVGVGQFKVRRWFYFEGGLVVVALGTGLNSLLRLQELTANQQPGLLGADRDLEEKLLVEI